MKTNAHMELDMKDFFAIYDTLLAGIDTEETVAAAISGGGWSAAETETAFGIAMTVEEDTAPRMFRGDMTGMPLRELAQASKSWNLREASFGMAAVNAYYNTPERLERLGAYEPVENYCTAGLDLRGQTIGVVGHLKLTPGIRSSAAQIWTLERDPKPGDYPDSACDELLPALRHGHNHGVHACEQDAPASAGAVPGCLYDTCGAELPHVPGAFGARH